MKKAFFTFFIFLATQTFYCQEFSVSGVLVNDKDQPIEGSEIIIFTKNSVRASAVTDAKGYFFTTLEVGTYTVRCFFIGQIIYQTDVELIQNINLGTMYAFDNVNQLEGVELTGKKRVFETKVDRTVFNVENSIRANGGDAVDLLKGTPGVRVDTKTISLVGKSNVRVMINDRIITLTNEELINYLRSVSAESIKSIEVITTPPAKYDADGNSGLINIVLKKSINDSWLVSTRSYYVQNTYAAITGGVNFSYNKNKLGLVADVASRKGANGVYETMDTQLQSLNSESRVFRKDFVDVLQGRLSLEYKASEMASFGGNALLQTNHPDIRDRSVIQFHPTNSTINDSINYAGGFNDSKILNFSSNVHYVQKLDTLGKQFSIDFDYFKFKYNQERDFESQTLNNSGGAASPFFSLANNSVQDVNNFSGKIDFELPLQWATLGFGGKISLIDNSNSIAFFNTSSGIPIADPNQTNIFDYKENTQAAYVNFNKEFSKWQTQIGLRYESTQTEGYSRNTDERNINDYDQFFPTMYVVYLPNDNHSFSINYNKRIGRPNFTNLNPFRWYLNNFNIVEGNPFLQPSFTEKIEFSHNYKYKLNTSVYYAKIRSGSFQIPLIDTATNITNFVYDNFYDEIQAGINVSYNTSIYKWWETTLQASVFLSESEFIKEVPSDPVNGTGAYFTTFNSFVLNKAKSLSAEINYSYYSQSRSVLNRFSDYSNLDVGLRYTTPNKKWNFSLNGFDLFRDYFTFATSQINNTPQTRSIYPDDRSFRIGVNYKFGNSKIRVNERASGNSDEKGRVK